MDPGLERRAGVPEWLARFYRRGGCYHLDNLPEPYKPPRESSKTSKPG
jgi:hypothetical protein